MTIHLIYDTDPETIEDTFGEDGPWSGYTHDAHNPSNFRLSRSSSVRFENYETFYNQKDPGVDELWAVWNIYSDGGTFGRTEGYVDAVWVGVSEEEAIHQEEIAKSIEYGYFGDRMETRREKMFVSL